MTAVQKRRLGFQLAAALVGLGVLGLLVWNVGVAEVAGHLRQIGWRAPLLLLPYVAVALCDAQGWACAIPRTTHARPAPLWRLSLARLAGEAINNLTPTANLGGEPIKVYLLRAHGLDDRAIHDAVQVIGYFNYITRLADALGVEPEDFIQPWGQ